MKRFPRECKVTFRARTGKKFPGVVKGLTSTDKVLVLLGDDPFPVEVGVDKLVVTEYKDTMATTRKTTTKRTAKAAAEAAPRRRRNRTATVASEDAAEATPAKRAAKKAPAKRAAAAPKASEANPYRPGSNMFKITELLLQGGKRSAIVKKLQGRGGIDLHPYTQDKDDLDVEKELDKRVTLTAQNLERKLGYTVEKTGRGMAEGTIKVVPPAS